MAFNLYYSSSHRDSFCRVAAFESKEKSMIIREDKETGERTEVTYEFAIENLEGFYKDPDDAIKALDNATEYNPAFTPYANYWISEVGMRGSGAGQSPA